MGMLFFIGSEIALFGSFFMSYVFLRVAHLVVTIVGTPNRRYPADGCCNNQQYDSFY